MGLSLRRKRRTRRNWSFLFNLPSHHRISASAADTVRVDAAVLYLREISMSLHGSTVRLPNGKVFHSFGSYASKHTRQSRSPMRDGR